LFTAPAHPYTQKLFAALPGAQRHGQPLAAIPGSVPQLHEIPTGCRFAPRCDKAWALCHEQAPAWTEIGNGQGVRCHLYSEPVAGSSWPVAKNENPDTTKAGVGYPLPATNYQLLQVENLQVHFPIRKGILQRTVGQVKAVDGV
jgi:peptide/nickel transport system ATP-binding protein